MLFSINMSTMGSVELGKRWPMRFVLVARRSYQAWDIRGLVKKSGFGRRI